MTENYDEADLFKQAKWFVDGAEFVKVNEKSMKYYDHSTCKLEVFQISALSNTAKAKLLVYIYNHNIRFTNRNGEDLKTFINKLKRRK